MTNLLLYSPGVVGHPGIYCRVIADVVAEVDCAVTIAMGFTDACGIENAPDVLPLTNRERLNIVETRGYSRTRSPDLTAEEIVGLQAAVRADTTVFIEADKSKNELARIGSGSAPALLGRNIGIFANTSEWYPGEDCFTGAKKSLVAPTVRTTVGNIKRLLLNRRDSDKWYYERQIIGNGVLDDLLVKDERLAVWRGKPVYWMPELSRPPLTANADCSDSDYKARKDALMLYLERNSTSEPVLYFGDPTFYKGYDLFLKFVTEARETCAIHAGRNYDPAGRSQYGVDVGRLRAELLDQGRLFETNEYVSAQRLKELYFGATRVYITTHRLTLSSATAIQAAELGKPLLVPNRGLLGHRVLANEIGHVYKYQDTTDLIRSARSLWSSDLARFTDPLRRFASLFCDEAIRAFWRQRLLGH